MFKFEFGENGERTSIVGRAIFSLSGGHDIIEATDYDRRILSGLEALPPPAECVLRSSSEEHWVSHFASLCLERSRPHCPKAAFHTFCEIPSKQSEKLAAAGYDLSLGPYDTETRLRTMHKTTPRAWCDRPWTVPFDGKDILHLKSLANGRHRFFIVVHAFYCIHDWRRMGKWADPNDTNQLDHSIAVPGVGTIARTVIFDLEPMRSFITSTTINDLKIVRKSARSSGKNHAEKLASLIRPDLYRIDVNGEALAVEDAPLLPMDLTAFFSIIDQLWGAEWAETGIGND